MDSRNNNLGFALFLVLIVCFAINCCFAKRFDQINESEDNFNSNVNDFDDSNESKDFNFDDKKVKSAKTSLNPELKQMYNWWTLEDICKDVKCKSWEYCVIRSKGVAVCITKRNDANDDHFFDDKSKADSNQLKDKKFIIDDEEEDDEEYDDEDIEQKSTYSKTDENKLKLCSPCPVVKPQFICGSDNSTYSSICRLDFHNCVHKTKVRFDCKGFCPCLKRHFDETKSRKTGINNKKDKYLHKLKSEKKSLNIVEKYKKSKFFYKSDKFKKLETKNMQNSVLPIKERPTLKSDNKKCTREELKVMGSRLLDWFTVIIAEQKKDHSQNKKKTASKIPDCQTSVSYMFHHFDTNSDLKLSEKELYYLEHDQNEHCLQPYLSQCDEDNDNYLSAYEWCTCFDKKSQPCLMTLKHTNKGLLGAYTPQCDSDGFYKPMQCHSSSGICWCVDKNGVEFTNTRRRGSPDCKGLLNRARQRTQLEDIDDDDGDDDDGDNSSGDGLISV